jgi:aldose 1-epimerase
VTITLQNTQLRLKIVPQLGAGIAGLEVQLPEGWVPVLRPTPATAIQSGLASRLSCFLLIPYSGRIAGANFGFGGQRYRLRPSGQDGNSIHGDVRTRPWEVVERGESGLLCRLHSRSFADFNFPFALGAEVGYRLEGAGLQVALRVWSEDERPMPVGMGLHPYFLRQLGQQEAQLAVRAERYYPTGPDLIPAGPAVPVPQSLRFSPPRRVGSQQLDTTFTGWDGRAELRWPELTAQLEADPIFSHLVLFTHPSGALAIEPVSNAADGFNLMDRGVRSGVQVLQPGAELRGSVQLRFVGL